MKNSHTMVCYECGCDMTWQDLSITYKLRGKSITIKNVKGYHCNNCGYEVIEDQDFSMIEKVLDSIAEKPQIDMLNLSETADLLRVSNQTIYNKIKSGELKAFKVGREWRFMRPDIEAFMYGADSKSEIALAARGGKISKKDLQIIQEEVQKHRNEE